MSTAAQRLQRAGQATFVVHAMKTGLALVPAFQLGVLHAPLLSDSAQITWVQWLLETPLRLSAATISILLFGWLWLAPLASMLWLHALAAPAAGLRNHARRAAASYLPALSLTILRGLYLAALLAVAGVAALGTQAALAFRHDDRLADLGSLAVCAPLLVAALYGSSVHDHACVALALGERRVAWAVRRALSATRASTLLGFAGYGAAGGGLVLLGATLPRLCFGGSDTLVLGAGQLVALLITLVRGHWFARLVNQQAERARARTTTAASP